MSDRTIVADNLVKRFGDRIAVDDVSFAIGAGEIFGFLGPNGAGKSTVISMLTTLALPTAGCAAVGGYDVARQPGAVRRIVGTALQDIGIDAVMRPIELLQLQARLFGMPTRAARARALELLRLVGLEEDARRPVTSYSGGMKRRLDLAMALVHEPEVLFLDEPTTGLDPASRRDVWAEVRRLNRDAGMTIFLTTQYLEEVDELAGRVAIINRGKLVAEGAPAALKATLGGESINLTFVGEAEAQGARDIVAQMATSARLDRQSLRLYLPHAAEAVPAVIGSLAAHGLHPRSLTLSSPTLDDVFLKVTGEQYAEGPAA